LEKFAFYIFLDFIPR